MPAFHECHLGILTDKLLQLINLQLITFLDEKRAIGESMFLGLVH